MGMIIVAVAVLAWALWLSRRQFGSATVATLVLDRGHGIHSGTVVSYLGVPIGAIERVALHDGKVVAEMRIDHEGVVIRRDDSMRVQPHGIFGDKMIDLVPGPRTAPMIGPADTFFTVQPPERPAIRVDEWLRSGLARDSQSKAPP
jgi:ABC-type transporter Mla subunit MlaD